MRTNNLDPLKCFGFGSDGCSVMVGEHKGVATLMKHLNPHMQSFHCIAHKLALAAGQAMDGVDYLEKCFSPTLVSIYFFYKRSANRVARLTEFQKVLGDDVLKIKRAASTRWLSHDIVVNAIRRCMPALLASIAEEARRMDATAIGLQSSCFTYNFVASILMLSDVLPILSRLSKIFQSDWIDASQVDGYVQSHVAAIDAQLHHPGEHLTSCHTIINSLPADFNITADNSKRYQFDDTIRKPYLRRLMDNILDRFGTSDMLIALAHVFDPCKYPTEQSQLAYYADAEIKLLSKWYGKEMTTISGKFKPIVNDQDLVHQWCSFKRWVVYQKELHSKDEGKFGMRELVLLLLSLHELKIPYSCFVALGTIALTLPVSTAECERGFSFMNRIKSKQRSKLLDGTLGHLMSIAVEGIPVAEMNFSPLVEQWKSAKKRVAFERLELKQHVLNAEQSYIASTTL